MAQMLCGGHLSGMRSRLVDARIEGSRSSAQRFERHGSGEVEKLDNANCALDGQGSDSGHSLRAVEQGQAFFGSERQGLEAGSLQRGCCRHPFAVEEDLALADQRQCEVRKWREVAARPNGATGRNYGV